MEDSSGQRPFMKLKLSPGKSAGETSAAPEPSVRPEGSAPESSDEKAPASKTASPFIKAPANLSPSASRTPPVAKTVKPAAPGSTSVGPEPAGSVSTEGSPPPPSSPEPAPVKTTPETRKAEDATKSPLLTFSSVGTAPPPSTKLKLNVAPAPGEAPPALPDQGASIAGGAGEGGVTLTPVSGTSGASEPASTEVESRIEIASPSATPGQARGPAKKAVAPPRKNPVAIIAAGGGVALLLGLGVLAMKHFGGASVEVPAEPVIAIPSVGSTAPGAAEGGKVAEAPRDAAGAEESTQVTAPETAELARTRNPDLVQWLEGVRITAVSSDRITINRRIYAFGASVNPEGTLKWVGRDSVKGNLLFMDAAGVVYEKAPR